MKRITSIINSSILIVPIVFSLISAIHVLSLFYLGNAGWVAIAMAVIYEIAALSVIGTLAINKEVKKNWFIFIFIIIFGMQLIGNVYYSFEYINIQLASNPNWLSSFQELYTQIYGFFGDVEDLTMGNIKTFLSILLGVPIPLISMASVFIKLSMLSNPTVINEKDDNIEEIEDEDSEIENSLMEDEEDSTVIEDTEPPSNTESVDSPVELTSTNQLDDSKEVKEITDESKDGESEINKEVGKRSVHVKPKKKDALDLT